MQHHFLPHLPHYFSKHVSRRLTSLAWSVGMMDLAQAAVLIFEPVYLYTLGYSLSMIMLYYLAVYAVYLIVLPLSARVIKRFGVEHSIFFSQFFFVAYFLSLSGASKFPALLFVAPLLFAFQKMLYWPAFHVDFMLFSDEGQRGREVSAVATVSSSMYVVGPSVGGLIISIWGFPVLFIFVSVLLILSSLPLLRIKEIHSIEEESYRGAFHHLEERTNRHWLLRIMGFGEELIGVYVWPIFIFVIVGNFSLIGSLVTSATLATTILLLLIGRTTDSRSRTTVGRVGIFGNALSWIIRTAAITGGRVFAIDTLSRVTKNMFFVPLITDLYEFGKSRPLNTAIFFEQVLSVAKVLAAAIVALLATVFEPTPWLAIFLVSGFFTLMYLVRGRIPVANGPA